MKTQREMKYNNKDGKENEDEHEKWCSKDRWLLLLQSNRYNNNNNNGKALGINDNNIVRCIWRLRKEWSKVALSSCVFYSFQKIFTIEQINFSLPYLTTILV